MTSIPETGPSATAAGPVVVVPAAPGPLIVLDARKPAASDEIGQLVDELFGPAPEGGPGRFDAALLAVGLGLVLWSWLGLHSTLVTALGVIAIALGLVLPLRSVWRRLAARSDSRKRRRTTSRGIVLSTGTVSVRNLVAAYDGLLAAAALPDAALGSEAVAAAHLAVVECAELVGERGPENPQEVEYVERRVAAIRDLTAALRRRSEPAEEVPSTRIDRTARALAGEELDARGLSSLQELADLERTLGSQPND